MPQSIDECVVYLPHHLSLSINKCKHIHVFDLFLASPPLCRQVVASNYQRARGRSAVPSIPQSQHSVVVASIHAICPRVNWEFDTISHKDPDDRSSSRAAAAHQSLGVDIQIRV